MPSHLEYYILQQDTFLLMKMCIKISIGISEINMFGAMAGKHYLHHVTDRRLFGQKIEVLLLTTILYQKLQSTNVLYP